MPLIPQRLSDTLCTDITNNKWVGYHFLLLNKADMIDVAIPRIASFLSPMFLYLLIFYVRGFKLSDSANVITVFIR